MIDSSTDANPAQFISIYMEFVGYIGMTEMSL